MRLLNIATKNRPHLRLKEVPEEFKFIQLIAKRYADTNDELERFYTIGVEASKNFKSQTTEETYNSKVAWIVEQVIKTAKTKNSS